MLTFVSDLLREHIVHIARRHRKGAALDCERAWDDAIIRAELDDCDHVKHRTVIFRQDLGTGVGLLMV